MEGLLDAVAGGGLAQARSNANQTIAAAGTWTAVNLPVEDFDDDGVHSTSANTARFTYTRAGLYRVWGAVLWTAAQSTTNPIRQARIVRSGTPVPGLAANDTYAAGYLTLAIPAMFVAVASGQYLELQVASGLAGGVLHADGGLLVSQLVRPT